MRSLISWAQRPLVLIILLNFLINNNANLYTEAKAANIQNNWTLPEEGFPVFYRFFRDKISWFEADAVCQFHHGNLVTVNNGIQFDASRAFLKELDVIDMVWIGLKSSQGSSQFTWANMNPLDNNAGYWAESFPSVETPLCAAVDPARDFRWHALHCGGPETAAFLCELSVPDWGSQCTVTAMPSVTIQYLSDAAAIRLSRDCGNEEGERHVMCRGGEDRGTVLSQLACNNNNAPPQQSTMTTSSGADDEDVAAAAASSSPSPSPPASPSSSSTDSSVSMAINKIVTEIQSIATNDTELQSVAKKVEDIKGGLGENKNQFKKLALKKKFLSEEKKHKRLQLEKEQRHRLNNPLIIDQQEADADEEEEEPMQGDAPAVDQYSSSTVTVELILNDTTEYLPHVKRMPVQDLKRRPDGSGMPEERIRRETLNVPNSTEAAVETKITIQTNGMASSPSPATTTAAVTEIGNVSPATNFTENNLSATTEADLDWTTYTTHTDPFNNETTTTADSAAATTFGHPIDSVLENYERPGTPHSTQRGAITHPMHINSDMTKELIEVDEKMHKKNNHILANHLENEDHFVPPMLLVKTKFVPGKQHPEAAVAVHENANANNNFSDDNAAQGVGDGATLPTDLSENAKATTTNDISKFYPASTQKAVLSVISADNSEALKVDEMKEVVEEKDAGVVVIDPSVADSSSNQTEENKSSTPPPELPQSEQSTETPAASTASSSTVAPPPAADHPSEIISIGQEPVRKLQSDFEFTFTNIENYKPYRPNRRRSLTKHGSVSYLRKILG